MKPIFHITSAAEAEQAKVSGEYAPAAFDVDGFIHCSYADQVTRVANFKYRGGRDLVLLEIDCSAVPHEVIDENLDGGTELFPHIYGRLPMSAVVRIHKFPCGNGGNFELPSSVPA